MELILIACCNSKKSGGAPEYCSSGLAEFLSASACNSLLSARKALGGFNNLPPGPDLGADNASAPLLFLPAYARYGGIVFTTSDFAKLYPRARQKKVLIVSALYGLLDAGDSIRDYQATMKDKVQGSLLRTWWKEHRLGRILEDYIRNLKPHRIHDLLSTDYRLALDPWPPVNYKYQTIEYVKYEFPGEGMGSLNHRGKILKRLLQELVV